MASGPAEQEPIAVIGMSCRLPGASTPDELWQLLRAGVDAITEVPANRWPEAAHDGHNRGGFIADVDRFDADCFGISPNEADAMDPQQRLSLELSWEAFEHARIATSALRGTATGVFIGAINNDYAALHDRLDAEAPSSYAFTGTQRSLTANRVSYLFGLQGPSMTVDAGQSSSLLAVQMACEGLRRGDVELALAGGVNLTLLPETSAAIARFGALSPDGRCYTFDSRANGYVRGEGGALVVLKPLSAALADGDPVHCVILGGAVNNDGGGDGLTVPSGRAQQEVIRLACQRAGVKGTDVQYVELHGTGTRVGDPIEAAALSRALAGNRPADAPLLVGSVKTNIGHLEGAAGVTGLLKVILTIAHRGLTPSLNFEVPNPAIDLAGLRLEVVTAARDWPRPEHRLVAGVSSFGIGGTNCHLVLAEPPRQVAAERAADPGQDAPWVLTARSAPALRAQAGRLSAHLAEQDSFEAADVAISLVRTRARFEHRAVLLGTGREELLSGLDALAAGRPERSVLLGRAVPGACALVFPGQGSQWLGMARDLLAESPVFRERLTECAEAVAPFVDYSLLGVLQSAPGAPDLSRVDVVQPALWAVMVSLAELWRSEGLQADMVIGHSQGEIAAAAVAGALSVADAARVVALRSRAIRRLAGGGMMSIGAPVDEVVKRLASTPGVTIAAVNGPRSVVVSGEAAALAVLHQELQAAGRRSKILPVQYASHSAAVDGLRAELLTQLAPVTPRATETLFISTLTGQPMDTTGLDAGYWFQSLRQPIRFAEATRQALALDCSLFIECSPHPVLVGSMSETVDDSGREATVLGTLRRDVDGPDEFRRSVAEAFAGGADIDWDTHCDVPGARLTDLPTYAFQRERHWLDGSPRRRSGQQEVARPAAAESAPAGMSRQAVQDLVTGAAAAVLGYAGSRALNPSRTFKDLGLDSAGAVEVCGRLRSLTGLRLPSTLTFDFPTPARLAEHVHAQLTGTAADGPPPAGSALAVADDPIAIVAMGCRFPGDVGSPEDLWRLVSAGGDAITGLPVNRGWDLDALFGGPEQPGTCATRHGGFLHDADTFDAAFFGLSPREALGMDPQQRLLLETSWETFERAGIDPADLAGTPTGVFVGAMATDYGPRLHQPTGAADGHLLTGTALSVASGRIAYTFGLQGPALTVDTACSSSLVAIQLASSALRRGECSLALAGGVTVMSNPGNLVEFTRQNGLAASGRAKAFSAAADGTSFAEGAGLLLLERLSDARRNGHPVLALIAGGAVNSDGASNGLTAPSGQAQQQVIRQALASAGLDPMQVDAVEAHGTGTALGDPIEATAILATYGRNRPAEQPLWLGSVKSNIGHTQAAAGVAGVIKMVLAMRHGVLPRTLHADEPTTAVDWDAGQVRLLAQQRDWVTPDRPRRAAVSSFGISGTNAHLILQAAPAADADAATDEPLGAPQAERRPLVWMLSARTAGSLRTQAGRMRIYAQSASELDLAAAGLRLARRASFAHRAAVVAADRDELCAALAALADGTTHPRASTGLAAGDLRPVFVFPGQGGQWVGMGRDLLAADETFAAQLRRCDEALRPHTGWSVLDVLAGADSAPALEGSQVIQPVLFALMVSLAEMWRSAGIEPAAVLGHSQGEIAAACVSGALSLADAAKVAALRSQVLAVLDGTGGVLSVSLPVAEVLEKIAPWPNQLWVAVDNGPSSTVIAGDLDAMAEFISRWQDTVQLRRTALDYASHTPHVEQVHDDMLARIGELAPRNTETAICSSSVGDFVPGSVLGTDYWYFNLAEQVRFDTAIRAFSDYGKPLFIEVSPHPVLAGAITEILSEAGFDGAAIGTLRRGAGDKRHFLGAVAAAWVRGAAVSWPAILGAGGPDASPDRNPDLPTYAFDRQRYWLTGADRGPAQNALGHPLLTAVQPMADSDGFLLTGRISRLSVPWLADHAVGGVVLLPGTAFVELALQAAAASGADAVDELTVQAPLVLPEIGAVDVQITVGGPDAAGFRALAIHSRAAGAVDASWIRHASGTLTAGDETAHRDNLADWPPAGATPVDLTGAYGRLAAAGYEYGPAFQGLLAAWRSGTDFYAEVRLPEPVAASAGSFAMHPALLDAALHILVLDAAADAGTGQLLPFSWSGIRVTAAGAGELRVRLTESADGGVALAIHDSAGRPVAGVDSLTLRRVPAVVAAALPASSASLYDLDWVAAPLPALTTAELAGRQWAVVGTDPRAKDVCDALRSDGISAPLYYELASVADQAAGAVPAVVVVPYLPDGQDEADDPACAVHDGLRQVLDVVQQWVSDERFADSRLVLVAGPDTLTGAPMWGLVRSAATEHPGRFVLADVEEAAGSWGLLAAAIDAGEPQCAVRDGQVLVPRLARRPAGQAGQAAELGSGTMLVTGGTSGLGAMVAAHLVEHHGVRDLLLTSRRGSAAPGTDELTERLEALGASVRIAACDVSDRRALTRLLESVQLTGVVHAAGVLDDATVEGLSPDRLDAALHPKVDAGWLLHELTAGMPLSAFVLFSSIAGVLGNAGQANYAAANAFLDALALHRRGLGLPAVSIAWGLWSLPTPMTAALSGTDSARLSASGLAALTQERGLGLLDAALRESGALIAADLDLAGLSGSGGDTPAVLRGLVRAPRRTARAPGETPGNAQIAGASSAGGLPGRLAAVDRAEAQTIVLDLVRAQVAAALGHSSADEIEADRPFTELGFDSLTSVELRNRLGSQTGLRLPTTLVFNQPTVTLLARYLLSELAPAAPAAHQVLRDAVDRVTAQLEQPDADNDDQAQVIAVLQAALLRLDARPEATATDDGESLANLGAASDEEIFSFIDKQL